MLTPLNRHHWRQVIDAAFIRAPDDRVALVYLSQTEDGAIDAKTVRRSDLRWKVAAYAGALRARGIEAGDLLIIAHTQNLESIYLFWAALWIGAIPSMFSTLTEKLDPDRYRASMAELVRLSEARAVLTSDDFAESLAQVVTCPVYGSRSLGTMRAITIPPLRGVAPDAIAFLQHSSGTTGLQKGVALSHRAVLDQIAAYSAALHLTQSDVVASWLPLYHDMGLIAGFLLPLLQGIPLVLMSPFEWVRAPALLLKTIDTYRATLCWLPNFAYNHMSRRIRDADLAGIDLSCVRAIVNCSEPVRADSHDAFYARFAPLGLRESALTVSYAMAENVFAVTQTPHGTIPRRDRIDRAALAESRRAVPLAVEDTRPAVVQVSCGTPIAGTQVRVVTADGAALPDRHVGELWVKSPYMLSSYYRRPDLDPFQDGWYRTGDLGYLAEGEVYVVGRLKDLIINAGKNIHPQDIEAILNDLPGIRPGRVVVFGVPDDREGTELLAVVAEVTTDDPAERKQINQRIRSTVAASAMVTISYVQLVDEQWLIKTSSGKIARGANRDKWLAERAASDTSP